MERGRGLFPIEQPAALDRTGNLRIQVLVSHPFLGKWMRIALMPAVIPRWHFVGRRALRHPPAAEPFFDWLESPPKDLSIPRAVPNCLAGPRSRRPLALISGWSRELRHMEGARPLFHVAPNRTCHSRLASQSLKPAGIDKNNMDATSSPSQSADFR